MIKANETIKKETKYIAYFCLILSLMMQAVFIFLKKWDYTVLTGNLLSYGDIVKISLRGAEGDLAIMTNHTPFVTSVKPCTAYMESEDGGEKSFSVERGLLSVASDKVTLIAGSTKWV